MPNNNSVVAIYKSHTDSESAINELQKSGFDMKQLSTIAKESQDDENVVGNYMTGDRVGTWGKFGAFWGFVPGVGPVVVGGPLVSWIVGAIEAAAVVGGLSAMSAGLYSIGIPKDGVLKCENALKADKLVLIAQGSPQEVEKAKSTIDRSKTEEANVHDE